MDRVRTYVSDVIENLKKGHGSRGTDVCDVEIGHGFEEWTSTRGWTLIRVLHIYKLPVITVIIGQAKKMPAFPNFRKYDKKTYNLKISVKKSQTKRSLLILFTSSIKQHVRLFL